MATMQEYINLLTYLFKSEGADQVASDMNKVGAAQTTTSTSALNLEKSFNSLERRMDSSVRAAQDYAKIQSQVAAAVAQNPALQERANNILALAEQRYAAAARGGSLYGQALNAGQAQMQSYAAQAGILGDALTALGTKGLAGAAAIGGLTLAYKAASDQAHELGQKAIDLKKFADTTGLSTNQVQALRIEASKVGVSSDETETALQRFTLSFEAVRQGSGEALETLRRYRPELAEQMRDTRSAATAIDILSQAYVGLTTAQQNALSRSFFGRGGVDMSRLMSGLNLDEATEKFAASGRGFTQAQAEVISKLEIENRRLQKIWSEGFAKMFAEDLLKGENAFLATLIQINAELKNVKPPQELMVALRALSALGTLPFMMAGAAGGIAARAGIAGSVGKEQPATFDERFGKFPSMTPVADEMDKAARLAEKINEEFRNLPAREVVAMGEAVARQFNTADQTVADLKRNIDDMLNALNRIGELKLAPGDEEARVNALMRALDAAQVLLKITQDTADATARHNSEMLKLADKYKGMSLDTALILEKQKGQLAVAEAQTGKARMAAQEQATINDLLLQGKTLAEATAIAAGQRAITQAQLNTGALQQLAALQEQYGVAAAVTGLQKIQAQEAATVAALIRQGVDAQYAMAVGAQQTANALAQVNAGAQATLQTLQDQHAVASASTADERLAAQEVATRNNLLRQGVSLELAAAVAAQERANAEAQINVAFEKQLATAQAVTGLQKIQVMDWREAAVAIAEATSNVERQTETLRQQNQMTAAKQRAGDDPVQGLINQQAVAYQQAYNNAINQGAEEQAALNFAKETQLSWELKINDAIDQQNAKAKQAQEEGAKADEAAALKYIADEKAAEQRSNEGAKSAAAGMSQVLLQLNDLGDHTYDYFRQIAIGAMSVQQALTMASTLQTQLTKIQKQQKAEAEQKQKEEEQKQQAEAARQKYQGFEDQIQQLQNQRALAEARKISPEAEAQVQSQQAYAKAIADGATAAQAQQIADLTLANALAQNTSAVQSNTEALSPYYASDPRLSHLGFRAGSSALNYDPFAQPAAGAAGPAALPLGSTLPSVPSPSIVPGGPGGIGGIPAPGATEPLWQIPPWGSSAGTGAAAFRKTATSSGGSADLRQDREPSFSAGRPVQVVQNFNAPVDRSVAAEMKVSAYQAAQAGMRSLRAVR